MWWVLLLVLLAGCAGQPRHLIHFIRPDGVTEGVAKRDAYVCRIEAAQVTQGYLATDRIHPFLMMAWRNSKRDELERECMESKGYVPSYLRAGREVPDSGPTEPAIDLESALGDWNALGDSDALFRESFSGVHTEIKPETVASVKALAQQGNVRSQVLLGKAYHLGVALPQNDTEAFYWFRRAAEQGDAEAPEFLAIMYSLGLGTTQDESKAVEWYQRAANQGNRYAQTTLADRYWLGRGVPKDHRRALELYAQAAEQGIPAAQLAVGVDYLAGYSHDRSEPEKGLGWLYKAANQGYGPAHLVLGIYFATGAKSPPEPVDLVEGYKWYVISGAHGAGMAHERMVGLQKKMTPKQIREAHRLALEWMAEENQMDVLDSARGTQSEKPLTTP